MSVVSMMPTVSVITKVCVVPTVSVSTMCTSFTTQGFNFHNMEIFLIDRRWNSFLKQCDLLRVHEMISGKSHGTCNLWESAFSQTPSDFILRKYFLAVFLKNEQLYLRELHSIQTGFPFLSITLSSLQQNIGYFREDGKWVAQ